MSVEEALRSAVWNALLADTGLCAALEGPRVYDAPVQTPSAVKFPYIRVGDVTSDDDCHWLVLHAFSRDNHKQAHIIAGALLQALDDAPLTLEGYRLINLRFSIADIQREADGRTYHSFVRFCATTEELK